MDLRGHLLDLVAPAQIGDELVPGAKLISVSTELGLRLTFDLAGVEVHVEIAPNEPDVLFAAKSNRFVFMYRIGRGSSLVDSTAGQKLCRAIAERARVRENEVLVRIARDAGEAREKSQGSTRIREVRVDTLLEPAGSPTERFFTLSPYVGCLIGCRFCYAQSRVAIVRRLEGLPETPWGSYVDVRINAAEVLARELAIFPLFPIKFCPIVSDPYQAVEARYRITHACLEAIRNARDSRSVLVLTRSDAIVGDAELIASIPGAHAGMSIPTIDDSVRAHFEPRGSSIEKRFSALESLKHAGVDTFAIVQPILPGSIDELADALAGVVRSVRIDVLYGAEQAGDEFADAAYAHASDPAWQSDQADALAMALTSRGVALWKEELPP